MINNINKENWSIRNEKEIFSLPTVIQSKTETTCGLPSNPKKSDKTQAKEAKATPELIIPANDFGIWRKPIPLIKKPRRGRRGISVIRDIMFSYWLSAFGNQLEN